MKDIIQIGQAVLVPFGRQGLIQAFVVGFSNYLPEEIKAKKINKIIGSFNKNFQIFITTTDIKHLNKKLLTDCTLIKLTEKKVEVIDYEQ